MKVLYVERDWNKEGVPEHVANFERSLIRLEGSHDVDVHISLSREVIRLVQEGGHDVLITHMAFNADADRPVKKYASSVEALYGDSLDTLREIRRVRPDLVIIIYTNAAPFPNTKRAFELAADHVIWKETDTWEEEIDQLMQLLEARLTKES